MESVYYRPPDVIHWLESGVRGVREGKSKRPKRSPDIKESLLQAAENAKKFAQDAMTDYKHRSLEMMSYALHEDRMEATGPMGVSTVRFEDIVEIIAEKNDRFEIRHRGGKHSIKPVAHLVSGSIRVPVGWKRSGVEVPFAMLAEELSARCGVEIVPE